MAETDVIESAPPASTPAAPAAAPGGKRGLTPAFEEGAEPTEQEKLESQYGRGDPSIKDPAETPEIEGEVKPASKGREDIPAAEEGEDVDPVLLDRALALGFTEDEINEMGNNKELERSITLAQRFSAPKEAVKPVAKEAEKPKEVVPDFVVDLDDKEFEPKLVKAVKDLNVHYAKKLADIQADFDKRLSTGLAPVEEYKRQQLFLTVDTAFAQLIASDETFKPLLGEGPMDSLKDKAQISTRKAIADQGEILENGYIASGQKPPPVKTLLAQAAQIVLGSKLKTVATEKVRTAVAARRTQFISRGTPSNLQTDKGRTSEERARSAVGSFLKSKGVTDDE